MILILSTITMSSLKLPRNRERRRREECIHLDLMRQLSEPPARTLRLTTLVPGHLEDTGHGRLCRAPSQHVQVCHINIFNLIIQCSPFLLSATKWGEWHRWPWQCSQLTSWQHQDQGVSVSGQCQLRSHSSPQLCWHCQTCSCPGDTATWPATTCCVQRTTSVQVGLTILPFLSWASCQYCTWFESS